MNLTRHFSKHFAPWAVPLLLVAGWQMAVSTGHVSARVLPAPTAVIEAAYRAI